MVRPATSLTSDTRPATLADKLWNSHVIGDSELDQPDLIYIDLHLTHEATSPQAFEGLRSSGRRLRRPDLTLAMEDHNVPTDTLLISDPISKGQVDALRANCLEYGIELFSIGSRYQGIVHVVAPELGLVLPGMSIACGDSHTSTHGAFGTLAFGIGTSEVEHVLATQTLALSRWKTMAVEFTGTLPYGVGAKDLMLTLIAQIGSNGASGYVIEYRGEVVSGLSMEGRMTLCNMTIEAGARAGLVAPDEVTFSYLRGRPFAPREEMWDAASASWSRFGSDPGATFDATVTLDVTGLTPYATWGTKPSQAVPLAGEVPDPGAMNDPESAANARQALEYMAIRPGTSLRDLPIDAVFIGSCTNGRIEDLRAAAAVLRGRQVAAGVRMLVVPGSTQVRAQAQDEGLADVFIDAGAEWRNSGCSMCLGMNPDRLGRDMRCASTSNRNFEGRQGPGARTHLVSPEVAAATAVLGHLASPADL